MGLNTVPPPCAADKAGALVRLWARARAAGDEGGGVLLAGGAPAGPPVSSTLSPEPAGGCEGRAAIRCAVQVGATRRAAAEILSMGSSLMPVFFYRFGFLVDRLEESDININAPMLPRC